MDREKIFNEVMETIYEMTKLVSTYESIPRKYGTEDELYMVEAHTLDLIGRRSKLTASEIAIITNKTKGAVSQIIHKHTQKELIYKYRNPTNFLEQIIELTEKGKSIYAYHSNLDTEEYRKHLQNMYNISNEDFKKFISIGQIFNKGIQQVLNGKDVVFDDSEE